MTVTKVDINDTDRVSCSPAVLGNADCLTVDGVGTRHSEPTVKHRLECALTFTTMNYEPTLTNIEHVRVVQNDAGLVVNIRNKADFIYDQQARAR